MSETIIKTHLETIAKDIDGDLCDGHSERYLVELYDDSQVSIECHNTGYIHCKLEDLVRIAHKLVGAKDDYEFAQEAAEEGILESSIIPLDSAS